MSARVLVEICAGDLESALAAGEGGAHRVELCDNLAVGGTTPSAGAIAETCGRLQVPVHVLIRPRAGDFLPSPAETAAMRRDIQTARALGAAGVVLGALRPDGGIDRELTARLAELARPMSVTFHKAFDQAPDPEAALDVLMELGIDRVLTSGGRPAAREGVQTLRRLLERARGRIAILAGGRLTEDDLATVIGAAGVREVHLGSAVARTIAGRTTCRPADGSDSGWSGVDAERVRSIVARVAELAAVFTQGDSHRRI